MQAHPTPVQPADAGKIRDCKRTKKLTSLCTSIKLQNNQYRSLQVFHSGVTLNKSRWHVMFRPAAETQERNNFPSLEMIDLN